MSLYFLVILLAFAGPLALSFDKKVHYYTHIKSVFSAILIVGGAFIIWDQIFTDAGVWGFNPRYIQGWYIGRLPLEEILFFVIVPYNCLFIHEVQKAYFPSVKLEKTVLISQISFVVFGIVLLYFGATNYYTLSAVGVSFLLLLLALQTRQRFVPRFFLTYLIALIPFLIVNGILTGFTTPEPIVWYSESHIVGWRIGTIPIEDLYYNFSMLFPMVWIHERYLSAST